MAEKHTYKAEYVDYETVKALEVRYATITTEARYKRGDVVETKNGKVRILF